MEKHREGQGHLHCIFIDLEKAYDRVPRSEVWNCLRLKGVKEKHIRLIQDMYARQESDVWLRDRDGLFDGAGAEEGAMGHDVCG